MYGISEIAATKSLVVASSVQVLPEQLLLVGVIPNPQDQHSVLAVYSALHRNDGAASIGFYYLQMGRNVVLQQLDMADDADHVAAPAHTFQNYPGVIDGTIIQCTEAFIDKQCIYLRTGFLSGCGHADGKGRPAAPHYRGFRRWSAPSY